MNVLKSGDTLTLTLPSGETIQLGLDGGRKRISREEPLVKIGDMTRTLKERVLKYFQEHPRDWVKSKEIRDAVNDGSWDGMSNALFMLKRDKNLETRSAGNKFGKVFFEYHLAKKGGTQ